MKWAKTRRADLRGCSNRAGSDITCRCLFLLLFLLRDPGVILPRSLGKTDDGDQRVRLEQISGDDVARKVRKMRAVEAVSNAVFDAVADAVADALADADADFLSPTTNNASPQRLFTPSSQNRIPSTRKDVFERRVIKAPSSTVILAKKAARSIKTPIEATG